MPWIPWNYTRNVSIRNFRSSAANPEKELDTKTVNEPEMQTVPLRPRDKRFLVWSGKYKRIEDVPDRASRAVVSKAFTVVKVKFCNYLMVASVFAAAIILMIGKREAGQGMTLSKMTEDRHREYNRKFEEQKQLNK